VNVRPEAECTTDVESLSCLEIASKIGRRGSVERYRVYEYGLPG
jgi:hypothetical protein